MASSKAQQIIRHAIPLVKTYGFTRGAIAQGSLSVTSSAGPLPDTAISALFGEGDEARKTLIRAWIDDARENMKAVGSDQPPSMRQVLQARLKWNEQVLTFLPEAFALLATPRSGLPMMDPRPALKHSAKIADEACWVTHDTATGTGWYAKRAVLTAIYSAAELHQLTSPASASAFLDTLLELSHSAESSLEEATFFGSYVLHSWKNIIKSTGTL